MSAEIRASLGERRMAALRAEAERLEMSEQEYLRYALDLALNRRQAAVESPPDRRQIAAGGTSKEGGVGEEAVPVQQPLSVEGEGGGIPGGGNTSTVEYTSPPKLERRERERRRARVAAPPPEVLPAELRAVPGLREVLVEFGEYRRTEQRARSPMTARAWTILLNALARDAGPHACLALRYAMAKGWQSWELGFHDGKSWADIARLLDGTPAELPRRQPTADGVFTRIMSLLDELTPKRGKAWESAVMDRISGRDRDLEFLLTVEADLTHGRDHVAGSDAEKRGSGASGSGSGVAGPATAGGGAAPPPRGGLLAAQTPLDLRGDAGAGGAAGRADPPGLAGRPWLDFGGGGGDAGRSHRP